MKNENPIISANLTLFEEFQKLTVSEKIDVMRWEKLMHTPFQLKVKLTTSPKDNVKYSSTIFDTTFDACKLSTGFTASLILRVVYEKLNRYSNITFSCPFRKVCEQLNEYICTNKWKNLNFQGLYQIVNYEADDVGFPMVLVQNRLLFLETTMKGRLKKIRKIFDLLTFKCTVEFK